MDWYVNFAIQGGAQSNDNTVTGGLDSGVMKFVGDAVRDQVRQPLFISYLLLTRC